MDKTDAKREPRDEDWPGTVKTRDELDSALEAGLKSGRSPDNILDILKRVQDRHKDG